MKKLLILIFAMFMIAGCSRNKKQDSTIMITRDNLLYALYNQDGEKLTDYSYKEFEEVKGVGYIVTNEKEQKGFINLDGEEVVAFGTYETIESADKMLYASKKVEVKKDPDNKKDKDKKDKDKKNDKKEKPKVTDPFVKENLYILNGEGEVLYSADKNTGIMKSGLPVVRKGETYIVLNGEGKELYQGKNEVKYAYQKDGVCYLIGFSDKETFYTSLEEKEIKVNIKEVGNFEILLQDDQRAVLYDKTLKQMVYVKYETKKYSHHSFVMDSAEFDEIGNIILTKGQNHYIYQEDTGPILITSYYMNPLTYASRSNVVYGPHSLYKNGVKSGELENCQLYPSSKLILSEIYPVYVRNKGYQYYDFQGKKVIEKTYLSAEPFDKNLRAVVQEKEDGYSLIDETGHVLTKHYYSQIKYIGSSYYAVYNETGMYGIVDLDGNDVFEMGYTTLPEQAIVTYNDITYMILVKNGRTYVYDIQDDMNVIFSKEGTVVLDLRGYFITEQGYYTFEGDFIK